jgi:hypothetical protein
MDTRSIAEGSVASFWQRQPASAVLDPLLEGPEACVFRAVRAACRASLSSSGARPDIEVFSPEQPDDHAERARWLAAFLPGDRDASFQAWAERARAPYLVHVSRLHEHDPELRSHIWRFVQRLVEQVGMPTGRFWVDAYVGEYSQTPFGVHLDGASNFTLGVVGNKTLRLWEPEEYWSKPPSRRGLLEGGRDLVVTPGRTIYWPARFWHVALPGEGLSVTLNVAAYWSDPPGSPDERVRSSYFRRLRDPLGVLQAFEPVLSDAEIERVQSVLAPIATGEVLPRIAPALDARPRENIPASELGRDLPRVALERIDALRRKHAAELDTELRGWLGRVSSLGLGPLPERCLVLGDDDRVVRAAPIVLHSLAAERLLVGAGGRTFQVDGRAGVALFERLAGGEPATLASLLEAEAGIVIDGETVDTRALVQLLCEWGALERSEGGRPWSS